MNNRQMGFVKNGIVVILFAVLAIPFSVFADNIQASVRVVVLPNAPGNLSALVVSQNEIDLSWTNNANNEDGFVIERQTASSTFVQIATVTADITVFNDASLLANTVYNYRVAAYDVDGFSEYSNIAGGETPSAPLPPPPAPSPSSGGGGGGGGGGSVYAPPVIPISNTNVTITGNAYPSSTVVVLKDGQVAIQTIAGPDGIFTASVGYLSGGSYIFSVYGQDDAGRKSTLFTFPVVITPGATTKISGVFLSPTIDVDKTMVRKGDTITIFGKSIPNAAITIQVGSADPQFVNTTSSGSGAYLYDFNTTPLDYGSHAAKAEATYGNQISNYSVSRGFTVGDHTVLVAPASTAPTEAQGDLNGDGKVNLVDFSILAYWYGRSNPPAAYRIDGAGTIDLRDFSIMAYYWTG